MKLHDGEVGYYAETNPGYVAVAKRTLEEISSSSP